MWYKMMKLWDKTQHFKVRSQNYDFKGHKYDM